MNRAEWYSHYSQLRALRPKKIISSAECLAALKELYDYIYEPKQEVFIRLAHRYKQKLGQKHFDIIEGWKPEAKKRASDQFTSLFSAPNPLLSLINKDERPSKYVPLTIKY